MVTVIAILLNPIPCCHSSVDRPSRFHFRPPILHTNSTPAAPANAPTTPIFLYLTPSTAAPVLCTATELVVALPDLTLPLNGVLTVVPLPVGVARLTLKLDAPDDTALWMTGSEEVMGCLDDGSRFSRDEDVAPLSTVKGSPHEETDCWAERPMRERSVVRRSVDLRILMMVQKPDGKYIEGWMEGLLVNDCSRKALPSIVAEVWSMMEPVQDESRISRKREIKQIPRIRSQCKMSKRLM